MKYEIGKLIGQYCMTVEDGEKIYDLIRPHVLAGQPVELDFAGVDTCTPPFLGPAIGDLLRDISLEDLHRLLKVSNMDELSTNFLEFTIEELHLYYTDETYRQLIDDRMERYGNGEWG